MKSRRKKPSFPPLEENTLVQLLRKSDRLLEQEMKDLLKEEKDTYNRSIRSRNGSRRTSKREMFPVNLTSQEMNIQDDLLPPIHMNASPVSNANLLPEMVHMAAFTPKLSSRPKSAPRNSVLGKSGVNYGAGAYASYQRMSNQYSNRRPLTGTANTRCDFSVSPPKETRLPTAGSPKKQIHLSIQPSAENIQVVPSSSVQFLLENIEAPSPLIPSGDMNGSAGFTSIPALEKMHNSRTRKLKEQVMKLPVQKVDVQVHASHGMELPLSARSGYDGKAALDMLNRVTPLLVGGLDSQNAIILYSPEEKKKSLEHGMNDSQTLTPLSARPLTSKGILRRYQNLNVPFDGEVTDDLSFSQQEMT